MSDDPHAQSVAFLLIGGVIAFVGFVVIAVSIYRQRGGAPLFQPEKPLIVPWGPAVVFLALLTQIGMVDAARYVLVRLSHPHATASPPLRDLLLAHAFASIGVLSLALLVCKARPADFGWSRRNLGRNILQGLAACALCLPIVYGIQAIATSIWKPHSHPVEQAIADDGGLLTSIIVLTGAVVIAPVVEEIVYRGIFLGWLTKVASTGSRSSDLAANAIVSFLFASMHAAQWPAPIPLFALSIGLGEIYRRSGGIVAPIAMHACFNALSGLVLLTAH